MTHLKCPSRRTTFPTWVVGGAAVVALALASSSACGTERRASAATSSEQAAGGAAPIYGITLPEGYRDWRMISAANVGAPVSDLRVKLGNDIAIEAYRTDKRPFPDGTIIARLAYQQVTSEENNKVFRAAAKQRGLPDEQIEKLLAASFVAGPLTNVQFMVKDSMKYASTGGWGFAQFTDGSPDGEAVHKTCFACHAPAKDRDFVFTSYSR
jgi:Cytochrome P460